MIPILTILLALVKAYIDNKRWPFENHWIGAVIVAILLGVLCYFSWEIYPVFLYGVLFNPVINLMRGLPVFYMGKTAWTDELLYLIFDKKAGLVWFFCNLILLILTI